MKQQPKPIEANTVLMADLEAREWSIVIGALRKLPYEMVETIIMKLSEQLVPPSEPSA